jgi:1-acyl-sn-glycerol-3-phosphate acyltransferase
MSRFGLVLRSLIYMFLMVVITIPWACLCFLVLPLPFRARFYITTRWNAMMIWLAKVLCGIDYRVKGWENLPDAPVILLSKHQSAWETIFLCYALPRPVVFVLKRELLYMPFFGWALALLRMIPIDRSNRKDAFASVVRHGRDRLAGGLWVIIFPEGTRTQVGKAGRYKAGGARLAVETKTPVVPIAVNSGECWGRNSFIKKPGMITVSIGQPISPEGLDASALMQKVEDWVESEMRVISPHIYAKE